MPEYIQIAPDNILKIVVSRINSTNNLWDGSRDKVDVEKNLYFQYYFDFSTAIEACIRNIVIQLSKNNDLGDLVSYILKANEASHPFFLDVEIVKRIISESNYKSIFSFEKYKNDYLSLVKPQVSNKTLESTFDYSFFILKYTDVKVDRNRLAHGLKSFDGVELSPDRLGDFVYIFYVLFSYYQVIYK